MPTATFWTLSTHNTAWILFSHPNGTLFATPKDPKNDGCHRLRVDERGILSTKGSCPLRLLEALLDPQDPQSAFALPETTETGIEIDTWFLLKEPELLTAYACWDDRAFCVRPQESEVEIVWTTGSVTLEDITHVLHQSPSALP